MASSDQYNPDLSPAQLYYNYATTTVPPIVQPTIIGGTPGTPVTTINAGPNSASGPTITFSGGATGYAFSASGSTITLSVSNPGTVRGAIGAAALGINTDITQLNGASQVDVSGEYKVSGTQVVGPQGAAVADATGAGDVVAQLNLLLARVRAHGLIAL